MKNEPTKPATIESVLEVAETGFATLEWEGGEKVLMDSLTANALKAVYDNINDKNKVKFAATLARSPGHLLKLLDFVWSKVGFKH